MRSLVNRNLRLFFSSKSSIFFSLLGALISFVLYLVFLRQQITQNWSQISNYKQLLDLWLMGGTLTVTAITTTGSSLGVLVRDRENNRLADLILTDLSYEQVNLAYLISAWIIGVIMQIAMFMVMLVYFIVQDGISFDTSTLLPILMVMLFSSLLWSVFNMFLYSFVKKVDTVGKINTIIGTASGFFAGVYMPIGAVPTFAQSLMKLTPAPYNAALFRQIMMNQQITDSLSNLPNNTITSFKKSLGITISSGSLNTLNVMFISLGILIILTLVLYRYNKKVVVNKI